MLYYLSHDFDILKEEIKWMFMIRNSLVTRLSLSSSNMGLQVLILTPVNCLPCAEGARLGAVENGGPRYKQFTLLKIK